MRKYWIGVLALALSVGAVGSVFAHEGTTELNVTTTKTKFDKTKRSGTGLKFDLKINEEPDSDTPPHGEKTTVFFPKNMKFVTDSRPKCKENLEDTTTEQAQAACPPKSQVSIDGPLSSAQVMVDIIDAENNDNGLTLDAVVTAFNGPGRGELTLHSRLSAGALSQTTILPGKLKPVIGNPDFGYKLVVDVPPLAGGAAISSFKVFVRAGKYVSSNCKSRTMKYKTVGLYSDGHPPSVATDSHGCTRS